jgi:hypothetical protein
MTSTETVANADIFLWALFELGGSDKFVDVETVFLKAFALAPQRLSWRTNPQIPDLKKCAKSLQEAEARRPKLLLKNGAYLRMLSVEGQQWIEDNFERLVSVLSPSVTVQAPRRYRSSRLVSQARISDVFSAWKGSMELPLERWKIAQFLNCSIDSAPSVWNRRLEELRSAAFAAGDDSLAALVDRLKADHQEWFSNGD